jgi:subtilisin family serine protease
LKDATSLDCPEDVVSQLNVREVRVFHILDLNADKQIGADKVWANGIDGSGVKVAILDTGIDTDHPELKDSYLGGYDYVNNDAIPEDDHGHGTHVSGIITANGMDANAKGVAPGTGIYMYKVCDANGSCYEDDMIAAMEAAVQTDAKVMSISIGGGSYTTENCDSDALANKTNWVVDHGLTVVVAAGNDGKGVSSPGCASKAIAVGAIDSNNNVQYWSGRGPALDIVAPGYQIYSTLIGGYGTMSGTSMATPHVAGVVALLLNANSDLTTDEIKTAIYNTANPVNKCYKCALWLGSSCYGQAEVTCTHDITGAGVVDAYKAYLYVLPSTTISSSTSTSTTISTTSSSTTINTTSSSSTSTTSTTTSVSTTTTSISTSSSTTTSITTSSTTSSTTIVSTTSTTTSTTSSTSTSSTTSSSSTSTTSSTTTTISTNKCWNAQYQYLYMNSNQMRKFCKCAEGEYGYQSYSYSFGTKTVYYYVDSGNNLNWAVSSRPFFIPVYRVRCSNGQWYSTNQNYYYG